jgi:hypothetical protein
MRFGQAMTKEEREKVQELRSIEAEENGACYIFTKKCEKAETGNCNLTPIAIRVFGMPELRLK